MNWYKFSQNNTGGSFVRNDKVVESVYIEADNEHDANDKAYELGIYFNGVQMGKDCPCCGDRWCEADEYSKIDFPVDWDGKGTTILTKIEDYVSHSINYFPFSLRESAYLYYSNGSKKVIKVKEKDNG